MKKYPLLIMITTYARGYNLPAIVESVVSQTFKDYKIVICDDCSPNDPTEIIKKIKKQYPKVAIEHHRNHKRVGEAINIAATLGREWDNDFKYLVLLQDDTVYLDNTFLESGINSLEQNPDAVYFAGIHSFDGVNYVKFNIPDDSLVFKMNGLNLWRNWTPGLLHWAACIFKYDDVLGYLLSAARRDVNNNDALLLIRFAMRNYIIILNHFIMNVSFNKIDGGGYGSQFKDPIDRFVREEKYHKLASESAIAYKVSKEEANNWLLKQQLNLAILTINRIGKNPEMLRKFMLTLMDYDKNLPIFLLNAILEPAMR